MILRDEAFSGFSVNDIDAAREFYGNVLGLNIDDAMAGAIGIGIGGGKQVFIYPKPDHTPATYTCLNFPVDDIDSAVADLKAAGVQFQRYEGMTDENDIARGISVGRGPDIAWFTDPAGNILSVLKNP